MLEHYYVRPETVDQVRASWIGDAVEQYVTWLAEHEYRGSTILRRVPLLLSFGEFAKVQGATTVDDLPSFVPSFVEARTQKRVRRKTAEARRLIIREVQGPIVQMLSVVLPSWKKEKRVVQAPFHSAAPGFFSYLQLERGLRHRTFQSYTHHLRRFERYLEGLGLVELGDLSPPPISGFITTRATELSPVSMKQLCSAIRVFLRYCFREQIIEIDLGEAVESPLAYRLAHLPRSISWDEVRQTLACVERRSPHGKRDYALLLLMVTYGLRAREIARLTLDDIDWKAERLRVPERKAGHSSAFPLSPIVADALIDYLKHARPTTTDRRVFQKVRPPMGPMTYAGVSSCASRYLRKAGVKVRRPGSHTLRHTCVQRLVDADFSLKLIGDYIGHRAPSSTEIYSKVDVERLREVALGAEEEIL